MKHEACLTVVRGRSVDHKMQMEGLSTLWMASVYFLLMVVGHHVSYIGAIAEDTFSEELHIRPLTRAFVASDFRFTTKMPMRAVEADPYEGRRRLSHFRLFPKALGEIVDKYGVDELHLSFTRGMWRHSVWGMQPPGRRSESAPSGVELWAWFDENVNFDEASVHAAWTGLCNALSGLFCASLNFVDATNTISPKFSFRRRGAQEVGESTPRTSSWVSTRFVRYATLPQEAVCTENLTPWKKLLPCGQTAGLAMLLNARQLFNVHYLSMGIHVRPVCQTPSGCSSTSSYLELSQTLSMVSELSTEHDGKQDWSFKKLYDMMLFNHCPVSTSSFVYVDLTKNSSDNGFELSPPPSKVFTNPDGVRLAAYDVAQKTVAEERPPLNVAAVYSRSVSFSPLPRVLLTANRFIKGYGHETGVIQCVIRYDHPTKPLRIVYMEHIPSFAVVYSHTFRVTSDGRTITPEHVYIAERADKNRPFHLEAIITLPPNSVSEINLDFDKTFLKWTAYPPDANHGFYIGPAVISANMHSTAHNYSRGSDVGSTSYFLTMHTDVLLLSVPTPDFSMPYNVICLVCTVVALAFGPLHNITTKRLAVVDPEASGGGIMGKIKRFLVRFKRSPQPAQSQSSK